MDVFGPRMLTYSSDGPKLHLDTEAFAFSQIRVVLGSGAGEWDYVTFEDPDGDRRSWEWAKGRQDLTFRVGRPGRYKLRYLIEGGYLTVGTVVETLDIDVRSPVRSFVVDRNVSADSPINVRWELEYVPPGCIFVFRCDTIRLAERVVSSNAGSASIHAPRAAGEFSVTLQGTNSRDSQLSEQPVTISMGDRPFSLQLRPASRGAPDDAQNAVVVAPGAEVEVVWSGELVDVVDSILVSPSEQGSLSNILESIRCTHAPNESHGRRTFSAPRDVGLYSVVYGVRYNHVTIPAALAHLAVSDRLAPAEHWRALAQPTGSDMTVLLSGGSAVVSAEREQEGQARDSGGALADVLSSLLRPIMHAPAPGEEGGLGRRRDEECGVLQPRSEHEIGGDDAYEEGEAGRVEGRGRREEAGEGGGWGDGGEGMGAKSAREGAKGGREMLCVVCLDSSVSVLIRPCNHVVLCLKCALSLKLCPMDRRRIEGRERIFLCQ